MDTTEKVVYTLSNVSGIGPEQIGGKAYNLGRLIQAGLAVPNGFCIGVAAYQTFIRHNNLSRVIRLEMGRKAFQSMRWEEVWDVALRIRSAFTRAEIPQDLADRIRTAVSDLGPPGALAVRSSAPGEDAEGGSFAGLHESVTNVLSEDAVLDAVKKVWASLWSDAAMLYQQELALDPFQSTMAVIVQQMIYQDISGVAFGSDPRNPEKDHMIIEAVPGLCQDLVDGTVDPDRWIVSRTTGDIIEWKPGQRDAKESSQPLLDESDLTHIIDAIKGIQHLTGWIPDIEWTGRAKNLTILQARPITTVGKDERDDRTWYLSLRPGAGRLKALAEKVTGELIPALEAEGERLARENLGRYDDAELARALEQRAEAVRYWKEVYWNDFIPFAHGIRQFGMYYNDAVHPDDPYEFVELLKGTDMLASRRNHLMQEMADILRANKALRDAIRQLYMQDDPDNVPMSSIVDKLQPVAGGDNFLRQLTTFMNDHMDITYGNKQLGNRHDLLLKALYELAIKPISVHEINLETLPDEDNAGWERRYYDAVGDERQEEARDVLELGRLSWRLRDDDNLLVGRLDSQLVKTLDLAYRRLQQQERLQNDIVPGPKAVPMLVDALRDPQKGTILIPEAAGEKPPETASPADVKPRQLVGQPAGPGLASGRVRPVRGVDDLGRFRAGEVLLCDAIQPTMTHLVPLASAIIERRGGMLIHGAIIARELGIPCVNGIPNAMQLIPEGTPVTVDGFLGIVTIGPPEFNLETAAD